MKHFMGRFIKCDAMRMLALFLAALLVAQPCYSAVSGDDHNWDSWGNGLRFERYSSAHQIDKSNVATLIPVWKYELHQRGMWELTPIVVGGVLYGQDLQGNVFALEPETGKEIWHFSSGLRGKNRAVSYWPGDSTHQPRIIMGINDRVYALDAATGAPVKGFGDGNSYIDFRKGFAEPGQQYKISSPPTIYKNLILIGPSTQEFGSKGPSGDPRAYDVITGKLIWRFHVVPQPGEPNYGTWGADGWKGRSGPGAWGMMSVDQKAGLVYIPVGQPADNFVGVDRPGNDLYSDSVVALDAVTGKYRWHYQMVHHDLWDYDVASPPALIDLTIKGKRVPALVEVTKQNLMFILNRLTGKPIFGAEERPVPQSTIPGEQTSPTQPFPLKPPPLGKLGVSRADISTITPDTERYCTDMWNRMGFRDAPVYTPPSLSVPLLYSPSNVGGGGGVWNGVSIDPRTDYIFVNVTNLAAYVSVVPDDGKSKGPSTGGYRTENAFTKWEDGNGMPCIQPPWGEMVAVNGNTGEIAWRVSLGKAEVYGDLGAHTGLINSGGSLVTAGGLLFMGSTSMAFGGGRYDDPTIRAYDTNTGLVLWSTRLSAGLKSSPMTFIGKDGRQYLVVTTCGRPNTDIAMVAFALPKPGEQPVDVHPAPLPPTALGKTVLIAPTNIGVSRVEDLPPGPGKDDVAKVCTPCHSIGTVTAAPRSLDGWTATVEEMRANGAKTDDAMAKRIATYLAANFGLK